MFSGKIEDYILFEDKEIIVCRKPAGIAVQNARIGAMDLESSLKNYLAMQDGGGRRIPYLAVIHRLDQPVEGILVFGKTPEAAKSLSAQITAGKMEKIYLAVTYGKQAEAGKKEKVLEDYLKKDGKSNTSSVVNAHTPGAKKARLSYEVLGEAVDAISGKKKWLLRPEIWCRNECDHRGRQPGSVRRKPYLFPSGNRKGDEIRDKAGRGGI